MKYVFSRFSNFVKLVVDFFVVILVVYVLLKDCEFFILLFLNVFLFEEKFFVIVKFDLEGLMRIEVEFLFINLFL